MNQPEPRYFNKQGRAVNESMRLKAFLRDCPPKDEPMWGKFPYRGFVIEGRNGRFYRDHDPRMFPSLRAAMAAVNKMLLIRAEVTNAE